MILKKSLIVTVFQNCLPDFLVLLFIHYLSFFSYLPPNSICGNRTSPNPQNHRPFKLCLSHRRHKKKSCHVSVTSPGLRGEKWLTVSAPWSVKTLSANLCHAGCLYRESTPPTQTATSHQRREMIDSCSAAKRVNYLGQSVSRRIVCIENPTSVSHWPTSGEISDNLSEIAGLVPSSLRLSMPSRHNTMTRGRHPYQHQKSWFRSPRGLDQIPVSFYGSKIGTEYSNFDPKSMS